jgi:transcriptional regulator of acetoin/glycerol metabolism
MSKYDELKALAEGMKGWPNTEAFECDDTWNVGCADEDGNLFPVIEIQTEQYDAFDASEPMAKFYAAANPAAILSLIAEVDRLTAENERIRELLAEKLIDSTMLTGIDIDRGSLTIGAKGGACGILADSFGQMLYEGNVENYIEAHFSSSKHPEMGQIVVTVKREMGRTPHQLRREAEAAHQLALESHRTTFTQLEQAKAVLTDLMESAEYWGEYDVPVGIVDRMRAVLEMSQ